ncbi:DUF5666 domain-containing protein [Acidicapsa ligni]|uniref:DUF5666 domain-containing protein n=1 Tax=Acidicapsa ligni TaxID=542300 RepID=UPI0021E0413D|nr:DUF5666 domain-containing protein [Acidicapsa ligni]
MSFGTTLESLTLTSQSGKQVTVLASPVSDEFIHLNGHVEPLVTVSIPQDVYVSAAATYNNSTSYCTIQVPGDTFIYEFASDPDGTVGLPNPVTVTGAAMGLVLNLQIASLSGGCPTSLAQYESLHGVTSAFNLTPIAFAAQPTNTANVIAPGLQGLISSVDTGGTGFTVSALVDGEEALNPPTWHAVVNGNTSFQAIAGASQLTAGLPVDMDLAIQPDGSLLATRVEVISTETTTLTALTGVPTFVAAPFADIFGLTQEGPLPSDVGGPVNFGSANFQISSQLENLATLPFTASFNAANMVPGQNLTLTTQATAYGEGLNFLPIATMTLIPQTINGTVSAVSTSGSFTTYTVKLAPYDIFPQFATQPGQTNLLPKPNTVIVYTDSNTQMPNSDAITTGGVFRFYGLVFNDNGTLRMDCAQITSGVAE